MKLCFDKLFTNCSVLLILINYGANTIFLSALHKKLIILDRWLTEEGYFVWLQSTYNQLISPQRCLSCMRWDQWETQSDRRSPIAWSPDIQNPTVKRNKHQNFIYNFYNKLLLHNKETRVCSVSTPNELLIHGNGLMLFH